MRWKLSITVTLFGLGCGRARQLRANLAQRGRIWNRGDMAKGLGLFSASSHNHGAVAEPSAVLDAAQRVFLMTAAQGPQQLDLKPRIRLGQGRFGRKRRLAGVNDTAGGACRQRNYATNDCRPGQQPPQSLHTTSPPANPTVLMLLSVGAWLNVGS